MGDISGSAVSTGSFGHLQVDGANFTSASLARAIPAAGASDIDGLSDCFVDSTYSKYSIYIGSVPDSITGGVEDAQGNTAIGEDALSSVTSAQFNTMVGKNAGAGITNQGTNVGVGRDVMAYASPNDKNTGVGYSVFPSTTGTSNTGVGCSAGYGVTSGDNNLLLGESAGRAASPITVTTGDNNICLGNDNSDDFYCADSSISTSDERDKTDIETFTHGLDFVNQMRPVTFRWDKRSFYVEPAEIDNPRTEEEDLEALKNAVPDGTHKRAEIRLGFIGQEVQAIEQQYGYSQTNDDGTPDEDTELIVDTNTKGLKMGIQYAKVVPILVNAIKELSAKVEALENA
jgi:hypothetical protein